MARPYGIELRQRVVGAIDRGMSARAAAARFSVAPSSAIKWHQQWRAEGSLDPARQGQPPGSKLDAQEAFILSLVAADKDIDCMRSPSNYCWSARCGPARRRSGTSSPSAA